VSSALGLIVISRRLARDPRWRSIASYTLVAGIVALVGFAVGGTLVVPNAAPLHDLPSLYMCWSSLPSYFLAALFSRSDCYRLRAGGGDALSWWRRQRSGLRFRLDHCLSRSARCRRAKRALSWAISRRLARANAGQSQSLVSARGS